MTSSSFISLRNARLHYFKTGSGNECLLLFHGFGQTHHAFDSLTRHLSDKYTLYCFDLFFHGQSMWPREEGALEKTAWREIIMLFLEENKIDRFSVLGFSMGGKFALATLEMFPDRVREVFLLAPDGIKTNFWYSLATYPVAFRAFFKSMISHHARFLAVVRIAQKLRLVDRGVLRFVEFQMNTEEKRKLVYDTWVVFRHLKFNHNTIAHILNSRTIPLTLLIGKYDKIITATNMTAFVRKINSIKFEVLEAGHNSLIEASVRLHHRIEVP